MANQHSHFKISRGPQFEAELKRLGATPAKIEKAIGDELITTANVIRNHIIKSFAKKKTGIFYKRTKKNILYQSSAPWEPPAVDTGDLKKSIKMDVRRMGLLDRMEVEVGSNLKGKHGKYPIFLEFGTKNMEPRPWLRPAFDAGKLLFYAGIKRHVLEAMK